MNNNYQTYQTLGGMTHGIGASTAGSTWNGSSWVQQQSSLIPTPPPPSTELPKIPPSIQGSINVSTATAKQLVTFYSEVYVYWNAQVSACTTSGDSSSTTRQWAVYYADLSSRAAHHYNSLQEEQSQYQVQPKAPPMNSTNQGQGGPPKAFQEYAHRCMKQCVTNTQRNSMKTMVELTIRKSLLDGSMHYKNWNVEPLLALYHQPSNPSTISRETTTGSTVGKSYINAVSNSFSNQIKDTKGVVHHFPVPLPSGGGKRKWEAKQDSSRSKSSRSQELPENNSYYGSPSANKTKISSKKKAKTIIPFHDFEEEFISLSSLSTEKYSKKHNKLVRQSSSFLSKQQKKEGFDASASQLASRANRFSGQGGIVTAKSDKMLAKYSKGIDRYMGKTVIGGNSNGNKLTEKDYEQMTTKGTCQMLEKAFLRLTAPPKAELVRPQKILEKHLENIVSARASSKEKKEYDWFCSQLKAIRQDLRVQRILNSFTVKVYETHATIALEEGDLNEYNQSQTQLQELYEQVSHASNKERKKGLKNENEFVAYRIIYTVLLTGNKKYQGGSSDLFKIMSQLTGDQRKNPFVSHALKVRIAVADNDYHAFFRLRNNCPNHGVHLMDAMLLQMRSVGLKCMMRAYRPSLPVEFLLIELGFMRSAKNRSAKKQGIAWLKGCGCVFAQGNDVIMAKDTVLDEAFLAGTKKSSLI
jgi:hypothetical protein